MSQPLDQLRLALTFPESDQTGPAITLLAPDGITVGCIPTSEPIPRLPLGDASVRSALALDVLEHVHDEQAWLAELARVLVPRGEVTVRVPLENLLGWADALNIYRYINDIVGIGGVPLESLPTSWHRHYAPTDIPDILELAGFEVVATSTQGLPVWEFGHFAGLLAGNLTRDPEGAHRRLFQMRRRLRDRPRVPMPAALAATITVRARQVRPGYRPDPDLDPHHRPERETDEGLE